MDDFFIDPDITKAETLPPRFYRSQEIFEKLKETVFSENLAMDWGFC